jgi:S1-C subfamily serine protease
MRRLPGLAVSVVLLVSHVAAAPLSVQEALLRSKPAVALVIAEVVVTATLQCGGGERRTEPTTFRETGTAWFVDANGSVLTNAHVVSPAKEPPARVVAEALEKAIRAHCLPLLLAQQGVAPGQRPDLERDLVRRVLAADAGGGGRADVDTSIVVLLSNGVKFPAQVLKYSPPVAGEAMSGRDLALLRVEAADMPSLPMARSGTEKIGDPLHILGFPGIVLTHQLLSESAKFEASVTNGSISGFKEDVNGRSIIQTDAPATWGNSGGPAVDDAGRVIGVLTFASVQPRGGDGPVQGFNFVIPVTAIREFLEGTPATIDGTSRFNAAWHAALGDFFAGRHARAARSLREANRLLPELPDVRRITAENAARLTSSPRTLVAPRTLAFASVLLCALGVGAAGLMRWRRNRFRIPPLELARLLDTSLDPPIILDARSTETYDKSPVRLPRAIHVAPEDLAGERKPLLTVDGARTIVAYCT